MIAQELLDSLDRGTYDDLYLWDVYEVPQDPELALALPEARNANSKLFQPEALSMIARMTYYYYHENPVPEHVAARRARRPW